MSAGKHHFNMEVNTTNSDLNSPIIGSLCNKHKDIYLFS